MNEIHISQIPEQWEGVCTYDNDLYYMLPEEYLTAPECRAYLERRIRTLDKKIVDGNDKPAMQRKWRNQRMVYKSILNYLNLYKL